MNYNVNDQSLNERAESLERLVLGQLLLDNKAAQEFGPSMSAELFNSVFNQQVFAAIKSLIDDGQEVDIVSVPIRMEKMGYIKSVDDYSRLADYQTDVVGTTHLLMHLEMLRDLSCRRLLVKLANQMARSAVNLTKDLPGLFVDFQEQLQACQSLMQWCKDIETQLVVGEKAMIQREARLQAMRENGLIGITTGIPALDEVTSGWLPEQFNVIAGKTGGGKSWFMVNHALRAAFTGKKCLIISMEMSNTALFNRELISDAVIPASALKKGGTPEQEESISNSVDIIKQLPITYIDVDTNDIDVICSVIREQRMKGNCDLVLVDYVQIIPPEKGMEREVREAQVRNVAMKLKHVAKQEQICVLALAQLNRNPEKNVKGKPRVGDIRESAVIEQFADNIFLIYTPEDYNVPEYEGYNTKDLVVYIMAKGREDGYHEFFLRKQNGYANMVPAEKMFPEGKVTPPPPPMSNEELQEKLDELYRS